MSAEKKEEGLFAELAKQVIGALAKSTKYHELRKTVEQDPTSWQVLPILYMIKILADDDCFMEFAKKGILASLDLSGENDPDGYNHVREGIASSEKNNAFPTLHARHTVELWNMLDIAIFDTIVNFLSSDPKLLESPIFEKIKISVSELMRSGKAEIVRSALTEHRRNLVRDKSTARGIRVYRVILEEIGFSLKLSRDDEDCLIELKASRNVFVHNLGIVDGQFSKICPWVKVSVGEPLTISAEKYNRFREAIAALHYGCDVWNRRPSPKTS